MPHPYSSSLSVQPRPRDRAQFRPDGLDLEDDAHSTLCERSLCLDPTSSCCRGHYDPYQAHMRRVVPYFSSVSGSAASLDGLILRGECPGVEADRSLFLLSLLFFLSALLVAPSTNGGDFFARRRRLLGTGRGLVCSVRTTKSSMLGAGRSRPSALTVSPVIS